MASQSQRNATVILQSVASDGALAGRLTGTILVAENNAYRLLAAQILEHLCLHYTEDDEYLERLKESMAKVMPEVLAEILRYGSTRQEIQAPYPAPDSDAEKGRDLKDTSSSQENRKMHEDSELQEALVSLCATICDRRPYWTSQLDETAVKICSHHGKPAKAFASLVEEARQLLEKKT
ncbi:hypothetical protein BS78_08G115800 [Paspalum vaginatum]|nr:hypothetical protein BS78_08G115800 [Paspalum vaginatum]